MTPSNRKAPAQPSRLARWSGEFAAGFLEPSRLGVAVMGLCFLAGLAGASWYFSPSVLAGPLGRYLARSEKDAEGLATHRVLQIRHHPPTGPQLLVLGSSAAANALASDKELERVLRRRTGRSWSVSLLTTPLQSSLDQLTLVEAALGPAPGPRAPVVIAVEMGLMRERATAASLIDLENQGRLGVRSDWADQAVRDLGGAPRARTGLYPLDNAHFVILNGAKALIRLALDRPAARRLATFAPAASLPPEQRRRAAIAQSVRDREDGDPLVYAMQDKLAARLSAYPSVHLVFFEARPSPDLIAEAKLAEPNAAAQARIQDLARRHGTDYWRIITEADIPASAYYDDLHIATAPEQARVRAMLASHVVDLAARRGLR